MLFTVSSATVTAQSVTHDEVPVNILFPDTGYIRVYGENTQESSPHRYALPFSANFDNSQKAQEIVIVRKGHSPVFIEKKNPHFKTASLLNPEENLFRFLEETSHETKIKNPREYFRVKSVITDTLGMVHIRAVQVYKGIEIYGSESTLHIDDIKERLTGTIHPMPVSASEPVIDSLMAVSIAEKDIKKISRYQELSLAEKEFLGYTKPACSLTFINKGNGSFQLAWMISLRPNILEEWKYCIDATTGDIIRKYNNTNTDGSVTATGVDLNNLIRTFNVYLSGGIYYMYDVAQRMFNPVTNEGIIVTLDANNTSTQNLDVTYVTSVDNSWTQTAAISAQSNATKTYLYFDTTFDWNSINGQGGNITSIVNIVADDGSSLENAFWNGKAVFYGNGGENFKPLAGALDVTAHELSHGVIAATANLEYYGQSGAISESFADIFACMVDRSDWTIGEDITKESYSPSGAMRNMADPHNMGDSSKPYWQPMHTSEMFLGSEDNNGIHLNSGICNYAFYLLASRIGKSNAEKIYFRALSVYLTKTSTFIDLRIAVVQSARDFFGDYSREVYEAEMAFETVGIYAEEPVENYESYPVNSGKQMLLTYDTSSEDPVSLYQSSASGTNYRPLTTTPMRGKASVTDDGTKAVFVSNERRLRMINTNSPEIMETIISGYGYYDHVAISKDGNRIAATKGFMDGSIYVVDLISGEMRQYMLYNPTTTDNAVDNGGVLKAYALEFDITGEYIIYDANNVINSTSLKDIYYRDIGIIRVWDNTNDSYGDGKIFKLFSSLPAHVNLANPVFAKNSPNIIAYDYFYDDGIIEVYKIYGANLETGENKQMIVNDRLGYPSFSANDDRIAYSTINGFNTPVVKSVNLKEDKITVVGEPGVLVPDAKWPVYYTTGIRPLGLPPVSNFTVDYKNGNYTLYSRYLDMTLNKPLSWRWFFEGGEPSESLEKNPVVYYDNVGLYKVTLITTNDFGSDTLIRENYIQVIDPTSSGNYDIDPIRIYPNPVEDLLHISCNEAFTLIIYNMQGNMVSASSNKDEIDLSNLKSGLYILELKTENAVLRQKLIKD